MSLKTIRQLPGIIEKFGPMAREYEKKTSVSMAQCVAVVFFIYGLLFLAIPRVDHIPFSWLLYDYLGMGIIILFSLFYARHLQPRPGKKQPSIRFWGLLYHSFLIFSIFFLWITGNNMSITPMFIIVICFGFTWLHSKEYLLYISLVLPLLLTAISLVEFNYFWFLEFVILYLFAASLHLFHVQQQCRFFEYQQVIEADRNTDGLTGLSNRRALAEAFSPEDGAQIAVILLDLDHFKTVNDTFGHAAGDRALTFAADTLRQAFHKEDLIARIGGDEFLILLKLRDRSRDVLIKKMRHLLEQVPLGFQSPAGQVNLTFSLGCYVCSSQPALQLESLIARADSAMYQVKQSGRNAGILCSDQAEDLRLSGGTEPVRYIDL